MVPVLVLFVSFEAFIERWVSIPIHISVQCHRRLPKAMGLCFLLVNGSKSKPIHCKFLEYWNTHKSLCRIWQHFSCLLDEGIPKIWEKLNPHDGCFSYLQNSTANSAHLAAHFCKALVCPRKATMRIQFLPSIFLKSPHQVDMKNVVKSYTFFGISIHTLETQSDFDDLFWL